MMLPQLNALKRAEELIKVGQKQDALQVLHDLITSRSFRSWQKPHEKIMFRYVELCVDLKMGRFAKDGLIQYRNSCQQVNMTSFEEVTNRLLRLATEKAEQTLDKETLDVDDLEVTPWFKFLWETYRTVLEILRNNSKLQALYAITAHKAFQFCKKYKRPTEFRRLCEIMRNNLANLEKYRDQRDRPDLTEPETLQLYLDTRFEQLKVAAELGLWQEAFRSVEDIYGLMCMVNKTLKPSLLVVYYSKLTEIFWTSSSHLNHAYAWLKLFSLQKNFNKNLSQKDLQLVTSSVVLAALSVPPFGQAHGAYHSEFQTEKERNLRMANLIGFNLEPISESRDMLSRESLLSELVSSGVLSCATQEVKDLYHQLEHEFQPLDLGSNTKPLLDTISKLGGKLSTAPSLPEVHLSQYVPSLEKLATLRLLQHVSKMYQTMKIQFLAQLVPFFDLSDVEKISVEAVKHNFIAMKVDHAKGFVTFGNLGIESDELRDPLTFFAETMNKVRAMLFPASSKLGDVAPNLGETVEKEHKRLLARQSIIEKRKEEQERQQLEMEHEEEKRKLKLRMQTKVAEQKRLASEVEERRKQRILREIEERELEKAQALLDNTERRQINGEERERKLLKLAKTMDYLQRAKREESTPLIEAAYQQRLVEEIESHEHDQQREVELSRERHESDMKEKRRVTRMLSSESFVENMEIFQNRVIRLQEAEFERQKREKEEHLQARKQERYVKRKRIYYSKCEEERIRKLQEEEEARKQRGPSQSSTKYIPKFRLSQATQVSGSADDQWGSRRLQHIGRDNAAPLVEGDQCGNGSERPGGDSWRSEEGLSFLYHKFKPFELNMSRRENSYSIPIDLIIEILSKLPYKSIARFSCLSKQLRSMLASPYFKELFFTSSPARPRLLFYVQRDGNNLVFFSSSQPRNLFEKSSSLVVTADFHMKLHKDTLTSYCRHAFGLVYFSGLMGMVIFNPSTGRSALLPKEGMLSSINYLGYDPVDKQLKVLCINFDKSGLILTLGGTGDNSWREISCPLNHFSTRGWSEEICINGVLYYFSTQNNGRSYLIVCFHIRSEEFKFIYKDFFERKKRTSTGLIRDGGNTKLINYKGKLGVITLEYDYNPLDCDHSNPKGRKCSLKFHVSAFWGNQVVDGDVSVVGVTATGDIVLYMNEASKPLYVFYLNIERNTLQRVEFRTINHEALEKCSSKVILSVEHVEDLNFINMETTYAASTYKPIA
ncbi:hypothetical protein HID58_012534 [Brassica napus]|uniref:Eukaryotic translation initiation factor 3 subunit 10 n=1 Tax=Brassica napus TaxID=3708 RepID=A0ABQ8E1B0_BRANA|nr:hypothetical protein HID58_012534 [Brassica napus]